MPTDIRAYRVFIASPGGLHDERIAFRDALQEFNQAHAIPKGAMFLPVGWEDTLAGWGRPQHLINHDLRACDFFVLVLWDRWGSPPDTTGRFTSGTEEEYSLALECLEDAAVPMRQIVMFFKGVDPKQLADPGPQLQKVLDFRQELESKKQHLYQVYDVPGSFVRYLDRHLALWLRWHEQKDGDLLPPPPHSGPAQTEDADIPASTIVVDNPDVSEARKLANKGSRVEAEVFFARATVRGDDPIAFVSYAEFLRRDGRLEQALTMLERAAELASLSNLPEIRADALAVQGGIRVAQGNLEAAESIYQEALKVALDAGWEIGVSKIYVAIGNVLELKGEMKNAEEIYAKALVTYERNRMDKGIALASFNLGDILRIRGDLVSAERLYNQAFKIYQSEGDLEAVALMYGKLGRVFDDRGNIQQAESMYVESMRIHEQLGHLEGIAGDKLNLGHLRRLRGELESAEDMYRQALELYTRIGNLVGKADAYGNLGVMKHLLGDLDGAEDMHRRSLSIEEQLGRVEGLAADYTHLGNVMFDRGELDEAEAMYLESLRLEVQLGRLEGIASDYINLSSVAIRRDQFEVGEQYARQAFAVAEQLGNPETLAEALEQLASALLNRGDRAGAQQYLLQALREWERMGIATRSAKLRAVIESLYSGEDGAPA